VGTSHQTSREFHHELLVLSYFSKSLHLLLYTQRYVQLCLSQQALWLICSPKRCCHSSCEASFAQILIM
jgi:hypothetical protein